MAIICAICGKSQSGWIMDFPLSDNLDDRICAKCHDHMEIINKLNSSKRDDSIRYINNAVYNNADIQDTVKEYIDYTIQNGKDKNLSAEEIIYLNKEQEQQELKSVLLTSGNSFEGYKIVKYIDFISVETVIGIGAIKALFANVSNLMGTESNSLNTKLEKAREITLYKLRKKVYEIGANGLVALDLDYTMFGETMIAVIMSGTAVIIEKNNI